MVAELQTRVSYGRSRRYATGPDKGMGGESLRVVARFWLDFRPIGAGAGDAGLEQDLDTALLELPLAVVRQSGAEFRSNRSPGWTNTVRMSDGLMPG
jgi:hypothetical protein